MRKRIPIQSQQTVRTQRASESPRFHCAQKRVASHRALDATESRLRKHSQETTDCQNKRLSGAAQSCRFIVHAILAMFALEMHTQCFATFFPDRPLHIYRETRPRLSPRLARASMAFSIQTQFSNILEPFLSLSTSRIFPPKNRRKCFPEVVSE